MAVFLQLMWWNNSFAQLFIPVTLAVISVGNNKSVLTKLTQEICEQGGFTEKKSEAINKPPGSTNVRGG